jgi:mannose-6-phosphate isomerase-like protein (cupin superfamily)
VVATSAVDLEDVVAHGGTGTIGVARLVTGDGGGLNFVDLAVVPPGAGIGLHAHQPDEEEYYLVLDGSARMTLDSREVRVGPGDLVRNPPGGAHSLTNDGTVPVRLFVFEVAAAPARTET